LPPGRDQSSGCAVDVLVGGHHLYREPHCARRASGVDAHRRQHAADVKTISSGLAPISAATCR